MNNFEAIKRMDKAAMEAFLDDVYVAGLNTGMYAGSLPDDCAEQNELLDRNPFDAGWLNKDAEKATLGERAEDGDSYLLDALTTSVLRSAGIEMEKDGD